MFESPVTDTLIALAVPVFVDFNTSCCVPPVPVTIEAVRPGMLDEELIAAATSLNVSVDATAMLIDEPPTEMFIDPLPSVAVAELTDGNDNEFVP